MEYKFVFTKEEKDILLKSQKIIQEFCSKKGNCSDCDLIDEYSDNDTCVKDSFDNFLEETEIVNSGLYPCEINGDCPYKSHLCNQCITKLEGKGIFTD